MTQIYEYLITQVNRIQLILTDFHLKSLVEIAILAIVFFTIMKWFQTSRARMLIKGLLVISVIVLIIFVFDLTVLSWLLSKLAPLTIMAFIVIFQDDFRLALEKLGQQKYIARFFPKSSYLGQTSIKTISEIAEASFDMGSEKIGALMVIERQQNLENIEDTGIKIQGEVSRELLINIFVKNTPLHDGAVLIKGNTIVSATCYLPLTNASVSKEFGTRHRAAIGMSEVSDAVVVVVSEETGRVSICIDGELRVMKTKEQMIDALSKVLLQDEQNEED